MRRIKKRVETVGVEVSEAVQVYLHSAHVKRLSPRTQEDYRGELQYFSAWCASHSISIVQKTKIQVISLIDDQPITLNYINDQVVYCYLENFKVTHKPKKNGKTEISSYTLEGVVRVLKTFLNWCLLDEEYGKHIQARVIQRIEKPQIVEVILETFSQVQLEALFVACEKEESEHLCVRDRAIFALLLDSGLRATELCQLTIGNISLDAKDAYVKVLGKGQKWGEVGLGEQARRALQKYIRLFREPTVEHEVSQQYKNLSDRQLKQISSQVMRQSLVFVNRAGKPLTKSGLWRCVQRLAGWARIEGVRCSPHTFRHTFSAMFIRNGGDIYKLSKLLRHSSVATTEKYLKSIRQSEARRGSKSVLDNL